MSDIQPKSCPHNCEDNNTVTVEIIHETAGVRVMCANCQASGPLLEGMDNAIKAWNAQSDWGASLPLRQGASSETALYMSLINGKTENLAKRLNPHLNPRLSCVMTYIDLVPGASIYTGLFTQAWQVTSTCDPFPDDSLSRKLCGDCIFSEVGASYAWRHCRKWNKERSEKDDLGCDCWEGRGDTDPVDTLMECTNPDCLHETLGCNLVKGRCPACGFAVMPIVPGAGGQR